MARLEPDGFNGAATFRLRKEAAGSARRVDRPASMGPQPFGCGRARDLAHVGAWPPASMGPQPFGCGRGGGARGGTKARPSFNGAATFRLRKGTTFGPRAGATSCFNGAATFRLRKETAVEGALGTAWTLQWGRNLSVAEGQAESRLTGGAPLASMGPQPFGCGRVVVDLADTVAELLQWGRNLSVAEGSRSSFRRATQPPSFNGAATFRLRKVPRPNQL